MSDPRPLPIPVAPPTATSWVAPLVLVAASVVVVAECTRVLFSVSYFAGESLGNVPAGLLAIAVFAAPLVAIVGHRVLSEEHLLVVAVSALVVSRVVLQALPNVGLVAAVVATAVALTALAVEVVTIPRWHRGASALVALAVPVGATVDVVLRATDTTWDIVWRRDGGAWALTILLLAAIVVSAAACRPREPHMASLAPGICPQLAFLLWPALSFTLLYTQDPAFLDSSGGVAYPVGLGVALVAGLVGTAVVAGASRHEAPTVVLVVGAGALGLAGFLLPSLDGAAAVVVALAAEVVVAGLLGATAGATVDEERRAVATGARGPHPGRVAPAVAAFVAGGVMVASGVLVVALHTVSPLPVTSAVVPAIVGVSTVVAASAPRRRDPDALVLVERSRWGLVTSMAAVALCVPLVVLGSWPADREIEATDGRPIRVVTFNIEQGLTRGELRLDEMAAILEHVDPDVVVLEEVGRGWSLSGMTDGAEWFSRRLRMPFVWAPAADHQFGNVLLSRLPIDDADVLDLGRGRGTQDRSAIIATLDTGSGPDLTVIGTHLMNGSEAPMHESRAVAYDQILAAWGGRPRTVLLGDLNTYPRDVPPGWPELDLVLDAGFVTTQDTDACTMPTSNENCPDWVFATADLTLSPVRVVVDRPDHRPLFAEVGVRGS